MNLYYLKVKLNWGTIQKSLSVNSTSSHTMKYVTLKYKSDIKSYDFVVIQSRLNFLKHFLLCISSQRIWVILPRKVSRFAPLNRYYIFIGKVFFDNFLVIIYLLVVCEKKNNSFILVYFNYLFISCIQKIIIIHSFWSTLIIYLLVVYKKK